MPKVSKSKVSNGRLRYLIEDEQKRLIAATKQSDSWAQDLADGETLLTTRSKTSSR